MKKVFVSGCFDALHSGHVAFFQEAAKYGDVYVGLGSDATIKGLKGRPTINNELERMYMVSALKCVKSVFISTGSGHLDFEKEVVALKPDIFVVNHDGFSGEKQEFCEKHNINLIVLERLPQPNLPARSTTALRASMATSECMLPYRIDLAGTWIDRMFCLSAVGIAAAHHAHHGPEPYVSKFGSGWALTLSLEPICQYAERCGMATSTRNKAKQLWPRTLPIDQPPDKLAEILFRWDNKPGTTTVSGAQDSLGICLPGLSRHFYDSEYWPLKIESIHDEDILAWLEAHIYMALLWPRAADLDLLRETHITADNVSKLTAAASACWEAILKKDYAAFAAAWNESFRAQVRMFPAMSNAAVEADIAAKYKDTCDAYKMAGAAGGGYLVMVCRQKPFADALPIRIRRKITAL